MKGVSKEYLESQSRAWSEAEETKPEEPTPPPQKPPPAPEK